MLKLTYLENDLYLEQVTENLEDWLMLRVALAVRLGQRLVIESATASFLLPIDLLQLTRLKKLAQLAPDVEFAQSDAESIEVCLSGTWVGSQVDASEGVFLAVLEPRLEARLLQIWQMAQQRATSISPYL
ncbi:MAG: hypothetical protein MUF72_18935 [Elainella sp. Prado103]|jgi:hypothetical protein|nr:hypothetical protein [Elainella sp. Prado103]